MYYHFIFGMVLFHMGQIKSIAICKTKYDRVSRLIILLGKIEFAFKIGLSPPPPQQYKTSYHTFPINIFQIHRLLYYQQGFLKDDIRYK